MFTDSSHAMGPVLTFIIGALLSITIYFLAQSWEHSELQRLFESSARNHLTSLQTDIIRQQEVVNSIAGLFASSQYVSRKEFESFVKDALSRQPSIQGLSWNPVIKNVERKKYVEKAIKEGFSDFKITELDANGQRVEAMNRDDYVFVYYMEPYLGNEKAMGFNIASHPIRLAAIERARDSAETVITESIKLVQEKQENLGYLLFKAIYKKGETVDTVAQRREHFVGLAAGVFLFKDLVTSTMQNLSTVDMDVSIWDESAPIDNQFLYFYSSANNDEKVKPRLENLKNDKTALQWQTTINVLGRDWLFVFTPGQEFFEEFRSWQVWALFLAGLLITVLLTFYLVTKNLHASRMASTYVELLSEIAERKTIDSALRESEKRYLSLIDSSPDWVWEVDANGVYTYASPKVYELLGYRPEEVVGKTQSDMVTLEDIEWVGATFAEIVANKHSFHNLEYTNRHKDGRLVILESSGVPIFSETGELQGYRGVDRDITQRIMNEAELRKQRDFTDTVLDAASNIIVVLDLEGRFVRFNRAAEELTHYSLAEVLGKPVWELVIPEEQKSAVEAVFNHLQNGEVDVASQYENEWLTREGGRCLLLWHNSVLRDDDGNISHIVAMGYDITEQKKAEIEHQRVQRELQQSQKMDSLGQLTGGIAHDFNNLLGIINGYTTLILDNYANKGEEKLVKYADHIKQAGDRAAKLVAQMLAFSRSDLAADTPILIGPLLKEDIKMLRATLPSTIDIRTEIEPDLPAVMMNPIHLHQILMNLSINARDAMQAHGQLTIKLGWVRDLNTESQVSHKPIKGDWIELCVADTGSGIDAQTAKNIFNPFFTTKEVGKGTGMGLSVIYGIMESHEGHILLESKPGEGSAFRMLFAPVHVHDLERPDDRQATVELPSRSDGEILVVDDELSLGNFMAEFVRGHGYQALFISDSMQALEIFQRQPDRFSLLITDLTMPRMTGAELIEKVKAIRPDFPVILCTGYSDKIDARAAKKLGIPYFEKPVNNKQLLSKITELLDSTG